MTRERRVEAIAYLLYRQASIFEKYGTEDATGFRFTRWDALSGIQRAPFFARAEAVLVLVESFP